MAFISINNYKPKTTPAFITKWFTSDTIENFAFTSISTSLLIINLKPIIGEKPNSFLESSASAEYPTRFTFQLNDIK